MPLKIRIFENNSHIAMLIAKHASCPLYQQPNALSQNPMFQQFSEISIEHNNQNDNNMARQTYQINLGLLALKLQVFS